MKIFYDTTTISFKQLQEQIELPSFQRSVVWTEDKQKNFIHTVISGEPFGSLLLYKEFGKYLLVDGLQRFSTLRDFIMHPNKYINLNEDCKDALNDVMESIQTSTKVITNFNILKNEILSTIKTFFSLEKDAGQISNLIIKNLPIVIESNDTNLLMNIQITINQMILGLKDKYNVSEIRVPVIIYEGEFDKLPDIFERINSNGTKLNKYDIYAAKWSNIIFKVEDASLLRLVDKKYEDMIKETGVDILNYDYGQICRNQKINLFEYCFALGKMLKKEYPHILGTKIGENSDVDSIGFVLLSVILTNSGQKIVSLPKYFTNAKPSEMITFKNKILECVKIVNNLLHDFIMTIDKKTVTKYIESQMVCIISTLFKIKYVRNDDTPLSFKDNTNNKGLLQQFKKNMPKRYIYDIISNYWSGNGDNKITDEMSKSITNNRYVSTILNDSWHVILNEWAIEQSQKPSKRIATETKLFINYIINLTVLKSKYSDRKFNFEYLVAKDRFNKKFPNENGLSSLGNICYFPEFEVKSKHAQTIYEQIDNKSVAYNIKDEVMHDFLYPERHELSFVKTDESFTYENYLKFLKSRNTYLINKFSR